jgi:hypothetical protein
VTVANVLPPSGAKFLCWTAFTTCRACPWREQDSPAPGRAPGPCHRSARLFVSFFDTHMLLGCTASRHTQRAPRAYAHAASSRTLFPDAAACALATQLDSLAVGDAMSDSPMRASGAAPAAEHEQQENCSPFLMKHFDEIFTPRFAPPPARRC